MSITIRQAITSWLEGHPKTKQWLWFMCLWVGGLVTVVSLTYPIKLVVHYLK